MKKSFYVFFFLPSFLFSQVNQLYILNRGHNNILAVPLDDLASMPAIKFSDRLVATYDMVLDSAANKLYWTSRFPEEIRVASIGDDTSTLLTNDTQGALDLEIDHLHQKLYFADHGRGKIVRMNLDGTNTEIVTPEYYSDLTSVALFPSHDLMFLADLDSAAIWKCTLNGDNRQAIVQDVFSESYPVRLAVDTLNMKLYWSDDFRNNIQRVNFDGSEREIFYQGEKGELIFGLYLDLPHDHLYWTDYGNNRVGHAIISTMEAAPIITQGINTPNAVVLVHEVVNGIEENQVNPISLAPNPANDFVMIPRGLLPLDIHDIQGRSMNLNQKENTISIIDFTAGTYVFRFINPETKQIYAGSVIKEK